LVSPEESRWNWKRSRRIDRWTERFPTGDSTTKEPKVRILNLLWETEQQDATDMLDDPHVQVNVKKHRLDLRRSKETCVGTIRKTNLSLRSGSCQENISVGEWLSTSIVHDLRNPLAAIYAAAEMLVELDAGPTQAKRLATNIYRAAGRMRELLADLNSFARGNRPLTEICDIAEIIVAASDAASATAKNHNVQILLEVSEGIELPLIRSRMERVFFNLIANAFEAMPNGGRLHISCRKVNSYVLIELEDTKQPFVRMMQPSR
jgi:signal transduction histidine kinase